MLRGLASARRRVTEADDWVLVHDAARPCLERADLDRLLAQADGRGRRRAAGRAAWPTR